MSSKEAYLKYIRDKIKTFIKSGYITHITFRGDIYFVKKTDKCITDLSYSGLSELGAFFWSKEDKKYYVVLHYKSGVYEVLDFYISHDKILKYPEIKNILEKSL